MFSVKRLKANTNYWRRTDVQLLDLSDGFSYIRLPSAMGDDHYWHNTIFVAKSLLVNDSDTDASLT